MKDLIIRALPYLLIAVFLDLIQIGVEIMFAFIGAFTGTLGGIGAGALIGGKICSVFPGTFLTTCVAGFGAIGGFLGSFLDPIIAPAAVPIATFIGMVFNIAVSISVGTAFIVLLFAVSGMFDGAIVMPFYLAKVLPISDVAPLWSVMVVRLMLKKTIKKAAPAMIKGAIKGAIKGIEEGPEAMAAGAAIGAAQAGAKSIITEEQKSNTQEPKNSSHTVGNLVQLKTPYKQPRRNIDGITPGTEKHAA